MASALFIISTIVSVYGLTVTFIRIFCFYHWHLKRVPFPNGSLIFGNFSGAVFGKKSLALTYHELYKSYYSYYYVGVYFYTRPGIVVRDPAIIQDVLTNKSGKLRGNNIEVHQRVDPLLGRNVFCLNGEKWKDAKNKLLPLFDQEKLKSMSGLLEKSCKKVLRNLLDKTHRLNAIDVAKKYAIEVAANCVFGAEDASDDAEFVKIAEKLTLRPRLNNWKVLLSCLIPFLKMCMSVKLVQKDAEKFFKAHVSQALECRRKNKIEKEDFLGFLIKLQEVKSFSDEEIIAQAINIFLDSFTTISSVLSFALHEIALNPRVQNILQEEIDGSDLTFNSILNMPYLDKVFHECLRKNPPVQFLSKVCRKKFTLPSPDGQERSVTIKPGTFVVVSVSGLHQDAQYYPDPEAFNPERFSPENSEARPKCAYLPFGEGPRACLGKLFAVAQAKYAMVHVLKSFSLSVTEDLEVEVDTTNHILMPKNALWLHFQKRGHADNDL